MTPLPTQLVGLGVRVWPRRGEVRAGDLGLCLDVVAVPAQRLVVLRLPEPGIVAAGDTLDVVHMRNRYRPVEQIHVAAAQRMPRPEGRHVFLPPPVVAALRRRRPRRVR